MRKYLLVAAFLVFVVDPAIAADSVGNYSIQGQGTQSCGTYVDERRKDEWGAMLFGSWIAGYVTAFNLDVSGTYNIMGHTDMQGLLLWLENYCQQHPTELFGVAAQHLRTHLYPKRIENAP